MTDFEVTERDILADNVETANKIKFLVNHRGWQEVIGPWLFRQRQSKISELLKEGLSYEKMIELKMYVRAIDDIVDRIAGLTKLGRISMMELEKQRKEEEAE